MVLDSKLCKQMFGFLLHFRRWFGLTCCTLGTGLVWLSKLAESDLWPLPFLLLAGLDRQMHSRLGLVCWLFSVCFLLYVYKNKNKKKSANKNNQNLWNKSKMKMMHIVIEKKWVSGRRHKKKNSLSFKVWRENAHTFRLTCAGSLPNVYTIHQHI